MFSKILCKILLMACMTNVAISADNGALTAGDGEQLGEKRARNSSQTTPMDDQDANLDDQDGRWAPLNEDGDEDEDKEEVLLGASGNKSEKRVGSLLPPLRLPDPSFYECRGVSDRLHHFGIPHASSLILPSDVELASRYDHLFRNQLRSSTGGIIVGQFRKENPHRVLYAIELLVNGLNCLDMKQDQTLFLGYRVFGPLTERSQLLDVRFNNSLLPLGQDQRYSGLEQKLLQHYNSSTLFLCSNGLIAVADPNRYKFILDNNRNFFESAFPPGHNENRHFPTMRPLSFELPRGVSVGFPVIGPSSIQDYATRTSLYRARSTAAAAS